MNVGDDVAIVDVNKRQRTLGVVQAINGGITVVSENGTGRTIEFEGDNYQKQVIEPTTSFSRMESPTEQESLDLEKARLIQQLNVRWVTYINSDPSFENVVALAQLLEDFNDGTNLPPITP